VLRIAHTAGPGWGFDVRVHSLSRYVTEVPVMSADYAFGMNDYWLLVPDYAQVWSSMPPA
jgi:hypothetical protein